MAAVICPEDPEEVAELYMLGCLSGMETAGFSAHLNRCAECREVLKRISEFISAIRGAAYLLPESNPKV